MLGGVQGSGWRGGIGGLPTLLMMLNAGGRRCTPLLLLALQKWHLGFWSLYILSVICPNYACTHLFSVPYRFFVFRHPRRHLSRCKPCNRVSGPKSPLILTVTTWVPLAWDAHHCPGALGTKFLASESV